MKTWTVARQGAERNIDIVRRFQADSDVFAGMATGTAIEQLRWFQSQGLLVKGDAYLMLRFDAE
ncbi:MAG: hypothetical protein FWG38_04440 [Defluviitaleaceae bacterium]|nr:hypothetical protein [Defluviitaleaceae bacterium]